MPDYSLVPVDHQPDFDDYSLVPVDYDPFAADGVTQQAQIQQPPTPIQPAQPQLQPTQPQPQTQPQQPATGAGQPGVNGPATGNSPGGSGGGAGVGNAGSDPNNPTWAQGWSIESSPFGGNPTPAQPQPQTQPQQPATGAGQPGVNGPATGNSPGGSGGGVGVGNAGSDPSNQTWAQLWSIESSPFGGNPTPTQPLTDDQLNLIRQKIFESAQKEIGSTAWTDGVARGNFSAGKNKCNLFVHEMLNGAGASPGTPNGWRHPSPPSAGQWAEPSYAIPGWRVLGPGESPQPGDVAAQPGNYSDATGHVVIVGPNNTFIGVGQREYRGAPEKIESIPKKDNIVRLPAKGPLLYRRFIGR